MEKHLIGPRKEMIEFMDFVWHDAFAAARERGELRTELSNEEIQEWLRGIHLTL
jgi:hypothetical protein